MPVPIYAAEKNGTRIFKIGRVGYDSGSQDPGPFAFTGTIRSEKISPAGEEGLCHFRRISLRVLRTGAFTVTLTAFVDNIQTQVYNASGVKVNQSVTITKASSVSDQADEQIVEMDIDAKGTFIEVEMTVLSTNVTGVFLPEQLDVHYRPIRQSRQTVPAQAT